MNLEKNYHDLGSQKNTLEKNILLRFLRSSLAIILLYGVNDFLNNDNQAIFKSGVAFVIFWACHRLIQYTGGSHVSRRATITMFMLAMVADFLFQGGLLGITSLDICSLVVAVTMVLSGKERNTFLFLCALEIAALAYTQVFHSEWIINYRENDTVIFDTAEIATRIGVMVYVALLYKSEFEKERAQVLETSKWLEKVNAEVSAKNKIIEDYNVALENMMDERILNIELLNKKLVEYSFVNSHKIRGPVARVLGLVHLMKALSGKKGADHDEYLVRLERSAAELDEVVRELTLLLNREDQDIK